MSTAAVFLSQVPPWLPTPPSQTYSPGAGTWAPAPLPYEFSSIIEISYQQAGAGTAQSEDITLTELVLDYRPAIIQGLVGTSILFDLNGRRYRDTAGTLFYGSTTAPATGGAIDVQTGLGTITDWLPGARSAISRAVLTSYGRWPLERVQWRTLSDPIRQASFQVTNGAQTAISDEQGDLDGSAQITGNIDYETGVYDVMFDPAVLAEQARYNAVALTYLPLDPDILGLDSVRLPLAGTVPVIQPGDVLVIHHTQTTALPNPVIAGTTYDLPRGALAYAVLYDAAGATVPTDRYTADLALGKITFENPLDLSTYTQPLQAEHRIEDMLFCLSASLNGTLSIQIGTLSHTFPAPGSFVSSAKLIGDLQATATAPFDQQAWTGVWSDTRIGNEATAEYNDLAYPIEVTNAGAVEDRFRIEFTGANNFRLNSEQRGLIAGGTGDTGTDFSPVNVLTGQPFFTIRALGWGGGWVAGNQLRFNTRACAAPLWLLRCTLQGPEEEPNDNVRIQFRGDSQ